MTKKRVTPNKFYIIKNTNDAWETLPDEVGMYGKYHAGPYFRNLPGGNNEMTIQPGLATIFFDDKIAQNRAKRVTDFYLSSWVDDDEDYNPGLMRTKENMPNLQVVEVKVSFEEV